MSSTRIGRCALLVFAGCLLVYAPTLYPTVPGGDAGELVAVAHSLGVAHPPGYPLWTLLAKLFTLVPLGSIAWRVAWLSALGMAAAAALIFASVADATGNDDNDGDVDAAGLAGGVVAAGLFAFSPTVWAYAVGAEVFALHCFFVALLCRLALAWERTREPRVATAIVFATGLGLTNHHTLVLHAAPILAWLLWTGRRELLTPGRLATLAGAGLLGLTPYAYLVLAGVGPSPFSWGETSSLQGLVDHLLRRDYGTFQLLPEGHGVSSSLADKVSAYGEHILRATLATAAVLVPAGFLVSATDRRDGLAKENARRRWLLLLAVCAVTHLAVFHWRANVPLHNPLLLAVLSRFWMQADVVVCILAGVGFALLARRILAGRSAVVWTIAAILVAARLGASVGERAGRGDAVVEHYGRAILEPLPQDALLLTSGDLITNTVRYLQSCEGLRPDVVVLDQELMTKPWYVRRMADAHPDLTFPGDFYHPTASGGFSMRAFLDANRGARPLWLYPEWKQGDLSVRGAWQAWPEGLASRIEAVASPPALDMWVQGSGAALEGLYAHPWPAVESQHEGSWERVALEDVWQARHRRALALLLEAIAREDDPHLLATARRDLEAAVRAHPAPPWFLWKNLGIVYGRLVAGEPGLRTAQADAWRRYLAAAPDEDADRAAIAAEVTRLERAVKP